MAMRKLETTTDLLDAMKEKHGWESDRQIALGLGIPQQSVSSWRIGRTYPTEVHALKIAKALGVEPLHVLAIAAADRSPDEKTRKEWLGQIAQIVAWLALGTGVAATTYTPNVQAQGIESVYSGKSRRRPISGAAAA